MKYICLFVHVCMDIHVRHIFYVNIIIYVYTFTCEKSLKKNPACSSPTFPRNYAFSLIVENSALSEI